MCTFVYGMIRLLRLEELMNSIMSQISERIMYYQRWIEHNTLSPVYLRLEIVIEICSFNTELLSLNRRVSRRLPYGIII